MASLTDFDIQSHKNKITQNIKNINMPLSAYQYYTKAMLKKWNNLSEDDKDEYLIKAKSDRNRYEKEKQNIIEQSKEDIKKLNIFMIKTTGRVPCIGLDTGFSTYTVMGPMDTVELFTEEEKKKIEAKGVSPDNIGKYKSIGGIKYNWRAAKKWGIQVYGGNTNNSESWWGIRENYDGKSGSFTTYTDYTGKTWTENH